MSNQTSIGTDIVPVGDIVCVTAGHTNKPFHFFDYRLIILFTLVIWPLNIVSTLYIIRV